MKVKSIERLSVTDKESSIFLIFGDFPFIMVANFQVEMVVKIIRIAYSAFQHI